VVIPDGYAIGPGCPVALLIIADGMIL